MQWKQVKDEIPPLNKWIAIGKVIVDSEDGVKKYRFGWECCRVHRPYDKNKKYNENYYIFYVSYQDIERDLEPDSYWMELDEPTYYVE